MQDNAHFESDFSLDDEYKPDPLAPQGNYLGHTIQVTWEAASHCLVWTITLDGNGGVMSDGETPIDGQQYQFRNSFPRVVDETEMAKHGRSTKRQAKINMLKQFKDDMQIEMDSPQEIQKNLAEGNWIGIPVVVAVGLGTYQGRARNQINSMKRREGDQVNVPTPEDDIPF